MITPFNNWIIKVRINTIPTIDILIEFKEHYQNLLSHEENLKNFREYFGKLN